MSTVDIKKMISTCRKAILQKLPDDMEDADIQAVYAGLIHHLSLELYQWELENSQEGR